MNTPTRTSRNNQIQPGRRRKKRSRLKYFVFNFLLFSLIIGLSAVGYASWRIDRALDNMVSTSNVGVSGGSTDRSKAVAVASPSSVNDHTEQEKNTLTLLVLGRDYRPQTGTNLTDVIIVAGIDLDHGHVAMVSIPRDTKVHLPGLEESVKANEALNIGDQIRKNAEKNNRQPKTDGPQMAKEMASRLLDIPIDNYVLLDFKSFQAIVDEVGGIHVNVERDMIYNDPTDNTHIHLRAGPQLLNGKKALDWVRHRQDDRGPNYYSSDFDRNKRQKEVIKAVADKLTTMDGLTKIFNVMDAMSNHIQTDLSKEQIKKLAWSFKSLDIENIKTIDTPNVYWDSVRLQTVIPEKDISHVQQQLNMVLDSEKNG